MRQVAVTEGDKVEAQMRLGVEVNGYGVGDLVRRDRRGLPTPRSTGSWPSTTTLYPGAGPAKGRRQRASLTYAARIELGLRHFLDGGRLPCLHRYLRGPAWAEAAARHGRPAADGGRLRLRRRRRLEDGRSRPGDEGHGPGPGRRHVVHGGLHLSPCPAAPEVLGRAHAGDLPFPRRGASRPARFTRSGIGGKADPVRLVFTASPGPAVNVAMVASGRPLPDAR